MERLFSVPDLSSLSIEMDGLVALDDGRGFFDFFCSSFLPWRRKKAKVDGCFNYVVITGHQNGVEVRVYRHLYHDKVMRELKPDRFDRRKGVEEYISNNDIYVVVAENGKERFFVLGFRLYPGSPKYGPKVNWDAYECEGLPAKIEEKADEQKSVEAESKKIETDKPLTAHPTIPKELEPKKSENGDGNDHNPAEQPAILVIPPAPAEVKIETKADTAPEPAEPPAPPVDPAPNKARVKSKKTENKAEEPKDGKGEGKPKAQEERMLKIKMGASLRDIEEDGTMPN